MTHRIIFVGDVDEQLSVEAKKHDASAWLMTDKNYHAFVDAIEQQVTVYTSLGDLTKDISQVIDILCCANTVIYCPPTEWSDGKSVDASDPTSCVRGLTETLLLMLPESVTVMGQEKFALLPDPIPLVDQRKTEQPQLWIAGCSISHGLGVSHNSRYGALLANIFDLPVSHLTRPGAAIDWAAMQILRSDIRAGDLVILGITSWQRLTHVDQHRLLHGVNPYSYTLYPHYQDIVSPESLETNQTFYNHVYAIKNVVNFCKQIKANLVLVGLMHSNYALLHYLKTLDNYVHIHYQLAYENSQLENKFLDLGTDFKHPGIQQHQVYAHSIAKFVRKHFNILGK